MLRCPATKCDYHIAVCLFCCLAPSALSPTNCAHVRATLTCYQNVLILPSCVNTSETVNTFLIICTNLWTPITATQHSSSLGCGVVGRVAPPTLRTTVCRSATPGTTHPATKHHVTDSSTRMILTPISEVTGTKLIWVTNYNDWGFTWFFLVPTQTLGCA